MKINVRFSRKRIFVFCRRLANCLGFSDFRLCDIFVSNWTNWTLLGQKIFIVGEIKHYLRDNLELIKSSRAMRELSYKINKMIIELTETLGHHPSDEELAIALQIPKEKVTECVTQEKRTTIISIDNNNDDSEDSTYSLVEKIEDSKAKQTLLSYENKMLLDEIINQLEPADQDLVRDYYYEELTYSELSLRYNLSQAKITSKLKYALDFIVKTLSKKGINNLGEE